MFTANSKGVNPFALFKMGQSLGVIFHSIKPPPRQKMDFGRRGKNVRQRFRQGFDFQIPPGEESHFEFIPPRVNVQGIFNFEMMQNAVGLDQVFVPDRPPKVFP